MPPERAGVVAGLAAYLLWGFLTVYWHELSGLDPFDLIGQRIVWSVLLLVVLLSIGRAWGPVLALRRQPALLGRVAMASLLLAANWTTYVWAVTNDNVVETALGYFIAPLGTVLIGVVVLKERLRPAQIGALGLATAAVVVLTVAYGQLPVVALILGVTWSVYGLLKKLVPLSAVQSLSAETFVLLPAAVAVVAVFAARGDGAMEQGSSAQVVLVLFSGIVTTVPLLLFAAAARRVPLTILGPLQYLVPTINFVLGVALYHEPMPPARVAGFALVWVALVVFTVDSIRARRLGSVPAEPETATAAVVEPA